MEAPDTANGGRRRCNSELASAARVLCCIPPLNHSRRKHSTTTRCKAWFQSRLKLFWALRPTHIARSSLLSCAAACSARRHVRSHIGCQVGLWQATIVENVTSHHHIFISRALTASSRFSRSWLISTVLSSTSVSCFRSITLSSALFPSQYRSNVHGGAEHGKFYTHCTHVRLAPRRCMLRPTSPPLLPAASGTPRPTVRSAAIFITAPRATPATGCGVLALAELFSSHTDL